MKYFIVTTKCGHVGKWSCIWIDFAVPAESASEALHVSWKLHLMSLCCKYQKTALIHIYTVKTFRING